MIIYIYIYVWYIYIYVYDIYIYNMTIYIYIICKYVELTYSNPLKQIEQSHPMLLLSFLGLYNIINEVLFRWNPKNLQLILQRTTLKGDRGKYVPESLALSAASCDLVVSDLLGFFGDSEAKASLVMFLLVIPQHGFLVGWFPSLLGFLIG